MSASLIPAGLVVLPSPVPAGLNGQGMGSIQQAFLANLAELQEAGLAFARAADPATREFASWMIADHSAALGSLAFIAHSSGYRCRPR